MTLTTPATSAATSASFAAGVRAALPLLVGLQPFALLVGAAVGASADPLAAWSGTLPIFSGSAHLTLLETLRDGTAVGTAVLVAVLINARLVVYSASLAPLWAGARLHWKVLAAATVVEPTYAVAEQRRASTAGPDGARAHYAGAAVAMVVAWLGGVTAGGVLGTLDGVGRHLAVVVPLCLLPLVVAHLRLPGGAAAVISAAAAAFVAHALVPGAQILLPMAAAAVAGSLSARRRS